VESACKLGEEFDEYPARLQVWFVPFEGGEERLLISTEKNIKSWQ
jgi:hypothetical protein